MKTSHAFTLAAVSLSLTLCACDKGDKNSGPIAMPTGPSQSSKPSDGEPKANPQPPESTEAAKPMNPAAAAAEAPVAVEVPADAEQALSMLNGMVRNYNMKLSSAGQNQMRMLSNKDPKAFQKQMEDIKKKAASGKLTSLDQLVTANMIKSIPAAPEGKKFVLDAATQTVKLENK